MTTCAPELAWSRLLCLVSSLQSTHLLDATHCNAALTMLRLHFQSLLHARLQDTDMQIYMVLGVGFVFLQMCSIKVNMHWKKSLGYKLCVFVSWGKQYRKKALSQAIKLNIELHSSSCLSMPLLLMLPPKQGIKGLECGVGKSQALSLAARDICKSLCQKEREGGWECKLETAGLYGMWLNSVLYFNELWGDAITTFWIFYSEVLKTMRACQEKG